MPLQSSYRQTSLIWGSNGPLHPVVELNLYQHPQEMMQKNVKKLIITYGQEHTKIGLLTLASYEGYILHVHLGDQISEGIGSMHRIFPGCDFRKSADTNLFDLVRYLENPVGPQPVFRLKLSATPFQLEVWRGLLTIPLGRRISYAALANCIGRPDAVRAVGTAVGRNPVAFLIPCHRVVHTDGRTGQYMWGAQRKEEILRWETALNDGLG